MNIPLSPEVDIRELVPGERYYAVSTRDSSHFNGVFTEYYTNDAGYDMLRFHYTTYTYPDETVVNIGSPDEHPWGTYLRVFNEHQSFRYCKISRFTKKEVKELTERCILRERRQYERALTGTISSGLYLPRDIVREISLKYVTSYTTLKTPYHRIRRHATKSQPAP
jgi:hypothetical protein